jgi:SAM-dependent methyltransferase
MVVLRAEDGATLTCDPARWHAEPDAPEQQVLSALLGPVLDVGCGPGRVVAALGRRGIAALGIDPAPAAVDMARRRGGNVLQRSVFDRLPGEGRWATVVLFDGNVGIGGDPVRLLGRCRSLLAPAGIVVVEVEPPGLGCHTRRVRLESEGAGSRSPWFLWAVVGADDIADLATASGLRLQRLDERGGRWFAHLDVARAAA